MVTSIGVDVSKDSLAVAFKKPDKNFQRYDFPNSKKGIRNFVNIMNRMNTTKEVPIVMESTGSFHLPLAMALSDGHHYSAVKVINGILTKKYQQGKIRQTKTDTIDSEILANIGSIEKLNTFKQSRKDVLQRKRISMLKKLTKIRQELKQMNNSHKESLNELEEECELIEGNEEILKSINKQISNIESEIVENEQCEFLDKVSDIKGVSKRKAAILIAFLNGLSFANVNQLVAFLGLDLKVRDSGTSIRGKRRLSKRGNPFLRHVLFQTAWGLKQYNDKYQQYYHKKISEGHHYYSALLAVSRKFLREFFYMAKQNALFS